MVELSVKLHHIKLRNPTVLAAGILGNSASLLLRIAKSGVGAVTTKSISLEKRAGHKNPVIYKLEFGLLNSIGLANPSVFEAIEEIKYAIKKSEVPVIVSFFGKSLEEFSKLAEIIAEINPSFIEANLSCPNLEAEFGKPFAANKELAAKIVEQIKDATKIPLIVKLTPNVSSIEEIAKSVEDAGADVIAAINSVQGMKIDIHAKEPVLSAKFGGLSGKAIKPIAIANVYKIYEAVEIPIIGIGGISTGEDAIEMLMAGASAVGIGTAVLDRGFNVFNEICKEMEKFMREEGYSKVQELIGVAHE